MSTRSILFTCMLAFLLATTACHNNSAPGVNPADSTTGGSTAKTPGAAPADTTHQDYFPIADYIRSEISEVDSTPLAILKYTIRNRHTDSTYIKSAEFHQLAREFLSPELTKDRFAKEFTERSFQDGTTGYLEFLYSTQHKELSLQRADVLVAHGDGPDRVKTIYLEKNFSSGDTLFTKKLLWTAKKNFQITTTLSLTAPAQHQSPITRQVKVVWDSTPTATD